MSMTPCLSGRALCASLVLPGKGVLQAAVQKRTDDDDARPLNPKKLRIQSRTVTCSTCAAAGWTQLVCVCDPYSGRLALWAGRWPGPNLE